jgi:stage V sporulation protein SpoVS
MTRSAYLPNVLIIASARISAAGCIKLKAIATPSGAINPATAEEVINQPDKVNNEIEANEEIKAIKLPAINQNLKGLYKCRKKIKSFMIDLSPYPFWQ